MPDEFQYSDIADLVNARDLLGQILGIKVIKVSLGYALARMEVKDEFKNAVRILHGGAVFTLADIAFAAASNSRGRIAVAINASIYYVRAVESGLLTAEAKELTCDDKLSTYAVNVYSEDEKICAVFQGMAYRKKQMIDFNGLDKK